MSTRTSSSSSTLLIVIILVLTFPFWIGLGGALIGVFDALFGAMIGVIAALFGALIPLIALPFKLIFGWSEWGWNSLHFHDGFVWLALLIFAALILNKRKK